MVPPVEPAGGTDPFADLADVPPAPAPYPIPAPAPYPAPVPVPIPVPVAVEPDEEVFTADVAEPEPKPRPRRDAPEPRIRRGPAPKSGGGGMKSLFVIGFFLLLPYALVMTGLAAYGFFFRSGGDVPKDHPLSVIPDSFGEFPPAARKKVSTYTFPVDQKLPPELTVALGNKLTVGALEIEPVRVEARPLDMVATFEKGEATEDLKPTRNAALVLHLKITNTSADVTLYPMDPAFTRKAKPGDRPATGLVVGNQTFWGGAIAWPVPNAGVKRVYDKAQEADATPLKPGETREYVVFTAADPLVVRAVRAATDPLVWRVQVRRGLIDYCGGEVPVTAVIGVEFEPGDVKDEV